MCSSNSAVCVWLFLQNYCFYRRCSLNVRYLSSADYQGAAGAHFHRAQLHHQLRLKPFRPVRRRTAVTSLQLPRLSLIKSVDSPPSADCGNKSNFQWFLRCLQQLSYGLPAVAMLFFFFSGNWQRTTVTELALSKSLSVQWILFIYYLKPWWTPNCTMQLTVSLSPDISHFSSNTT